MGKFKHQDCWWDAEAVCPFYHSLNTRYVQIICEGVVPGARISVQRFTTARQTEAHLERYCADAEGCTMCPVYRMVEDKYDENGNLKEGYRCRG